MRTSEIYTIIILKKYMAIRAKTVAAIRRGSRTEQMRAYTGYKEGEGVGYSRTCACYRSIIAFFFF